MTETSLDPISDERLRAITKKTYRPAQMRVLNAMGIPFKPRPDGSIYVAECWVQPCTDVLARAKVSRKSKDEEDGFRWGASRG